MTNLKRNRRQSAILAFVFLLMCGSSLVLGQTPDIRPLTVGEAVERPLKGGETHFYKFNLKADEFFQIRLDQKGIDVIVKLFDSNRKLLSQIDNPNLKFGYEILSWVANEQRNFEIEITEKREGFEAIPGTEKELNDIVRTSEKDAGFFDGAILLNKDFTKNETISLWRKDKYPVIHIASHFSFNSLDQTASFLLVGDGKLTFADLQDKDNIFGAVDLLTLSACDTAMSSNGKESEGFAYLAQSLGAKTVLASLWKVSDAGTPELMTRFYKLRAENPKMSKGEAFRQAQLSLLGNESNNNTNSTGKRSDLINLDNSKKELPLFVKDAKKPFAHPHYWSAFVLIGNWK